MLPDDWAGQALLENEPAAVFLRLGPIRIRRSERKRK